MDQAYLSSTSQICMIRLRSGDFKGQFYTVNSCASKRKKLIFTKPGPMVAQQPACLLLIVHLGVISSLMHMYPSIHVM